MGSSQGIIKRIYLATVRLYKSLGFKIGRDSKIDTGLFRDPSMPMDHPPELFTGDKTLAFPAGFDKDGQMTIIQDQPLPLNILAIIFKMDAADE